MRRQFLFPFLLILAVATTASAGSYRKTVPFKLGRWYEIGATDGPVTLHRIQVEKVSQRVGKSTLFRPGNSEYLQDVRIVLEYSNSSRRHDWEAQLNIVWVDASGQVIDGYNDEETLGDDEHRDDVTVTLSTLRYGLDRAKKLRINIDFEQE